MYADTFEFNGHSSTEYNMVICSFDNEISTSGGDVQATTIQPPHKDTSDYYYRTFDPIQFTFSVCQNPCEQTDNGYLDVDSERHIARWLLGDEGYHELIFNTDDDEQIAYDVIFTSMQPHKVGEKTVGFDLTATCNAGFGWSRKYIKKYTTKTNTPIQIQINNDIKNKSYPIITIASNNVITDFQLKITHVSTNQYEITKLQNIKNITLNSKNDIVDGLSEPSNFNYEFPFLTDGMNKIECNVGGVNLTIEYREVRRVVV